MRAIQKIEAAKYHLKQMSENLNDVKIFSYNLDAFLSCSRSVTFVLQREFKNNTKFDEWYSKKQKVMRNDTIMSFFKEMRNITVKEGNLKTKTEAYVSLSAEFTIRDSVSIKVIRANGTEETFETPPTQQRPKSKIREKKRAHVTKYYFIDYPDDDIVSLCTKYLNKLIQLIQEAKVILK